MSESWTTQEPDTAVACGCLLKGEAQWQGWGWIPGWQLGGGGSRTPSLSLETLKALAKAPDPLRGPTSPRAHTFAAWSHPKGVSCSTLCCSFTLRYFSPSIQRLTRRNTSSFSSIMIMNVPDSPVNPYCAAQRNLTPQGPLCKRTWGVNSMGLPTKEHRGMGAVFHSHKLKDEL